VQLVLQELQEQQGQQVRRGLLVQLDQQVRKDKLVPLEIKVYKGLLDLQVQRVQLEG
jgi:hypothetical protein